MVRAARKRRCVACMSKGSLFRRQSEISDDATQAAYSASGATAGSVLFPKADQAVLGYDGKGLDRYFAEAIADGRLRFATKKRCRPKRSLQTVKQSKKAARASRRKNRS